MTHTAKPHMLKAFVVPFSLVFAVFVAIALGRETGMIEGDFGKRLAAAMMGLLVAICGNVLPKVAQRIEMARETAAAYASADRLAGFVLVIAGAAYAAIWIFAPLERAVFGASMVGFGGFFLALGLWLWKARPTPDYAMPQLLASRAIAGRITLFMLLGSLFLAGALFPIDAIWGDDVAQTVAIIYSLMLPLIGVPLMIWAKTTCKSDNTGEG
jgi:hypothetical protein